MEREWIDVLDWNLRHLRPGVEVREASWGGTETDERGAVIRVAGRMAYGNQIVVDKDPETDEPLPGRLVEVGVQGPHPTRELLLEHGYADRAEFPLDKRDAECAVSQSKAAAQAEPERKVAETTVIEAAPRDTQVEPDPGEMGAPVDLQAGAKGVADPDKVGSEGYTSPFTEIPEGASAADPAFNPPEGVPEGDRVEDLVKEGRAEVLPSDWARLLRGDEE